MNNLEKWELQDLFICALRYALYRHSYVVGEICNIIKSVPEIQNNRVTNVMLRDIQERLDNWDYTISSFEMERDTILKLKDWLLKLCDE